MHTIGVGLCVLGILVFAIIGWLIYIRVCRFHVLVNKIPGNFYFPVIGNSLEFAEGLDNLLHQFQVTWPAKYGNIWRIFVGSDCFICISSPELLEKIFKSQKIIDKGVSYKQILPWLGNGLLVSSGDRWRSRRKLLTPAFHFSILNSFIDVFNEQSRVLCQIIGETCDSFPEGKAEMDVYPKITRCSLDIICETAMGTKINAQFVDSDYVRAVYRMGHILLEQFQRPWLKNPKIFALSALGREHNKLLKILHGFTDDVINKRREQIRPGPTKPTFDTEDDPGTGIRNRLALLDLLLKTSEDGKVLSHQDIRNEIDTFMFGGHDTTASLMGWFLYSMAANPDCQEKVWSELENTFGNSDRDCTQYDIPSWKYLECCIKETLRLYPSVPAFERLVMEDVQIGEYLIPAGCTLECLTFAAHLDSKSFPEPLVFRPERFLPDEVVGRHAYAYFPFSAGPRNCIGQRFAMLETKIVLSTLIRSFKFEISTFAKPPVRSTQITLKSLTGINLVVSRGKKV